MGRGSSLADQEKRYARMAGEPQAADNPMGRSGLGVPLHMRKSIRIYFHDKGKRITRECYTNGIGLPIVESIAGIRAAVITAIGTEEGAMCVHYKYDD
jgi:hypothetical protein